MRETYNSLACLTRTVDEAVNNIVLLSFASNLYFICVQLLQGMKCVPDEAPPDEVPDVRDGTSRN